MYTEPFELTATTTVKAYAVKDRLVDSGLVSCTFEKEKHGVTIPVTGGKGRADLEVFITGSTATIQEVSAKTLAGITDGTDGDTVTFDVSALYIKINTVVLSTESLKQIAENGDIALALKLLTGTVSLDAEAVDRKPVSSHGTWPGTAAAPRSRAAILTAPRPLP